MVDRSSFLKKVRDLFPKMYNWVHLLYSKSSYLIFGDKIIESSCGVQQGDPLGPFLFSLVLHDIPLAINECTRLFLNLFYLDDGTMVGKADDVLKALDIIQNMGEERGLFLNLSKCEIFWPSGIHQSVKDKFPKEIKICEEDGTDLLGAPISTSKVFVETFLLKKKLKRSKKSMRSFYH